MATVIKRYEGLQNLIIFPDMQQQLKNFNKQNRFFNGKTIFRSSQSQKVENRENRIVSHRQQNFNWMLLLTVYVCVFLI
jgi:hypothetical protein